MLVMVFGSFLHPRPQSYHIGLMQNEKRSSNVLHILLVISCLANTSYASCNENDRESLLSFSSAIASKPMLNWSNSDDCCVWEGVSCDKNLRVYRLSLPSRGLVGNISSSIANLSYLSELNLSHNSLSGTLPEHFLASLKRLQRIDLSYNRLYGEIAASDKLPGSILSLNFSSNRLSGEIQSSFFLEASNLEMFNVSNNSFTGTIPSFICRISPFIIFLDFSFNDFVGHISKGFRDCSNLKTLRASDNILSGHIPSDIYKVSTLQDLSLGGNRLSGSIDESIGNLTNLKILALGDNELTSNIPWSIGRLHDLEHLLIQRNLLNGTIPFSLSNCSKLTTLNLRMNILEGKLSDFNFSILVQLRTIDLSNNHFTGSFPASLYSCHLLSTIRLSSNRLQGEISPDLHALKSLSFLALSNNSLTNIGGAIKTLSGCKSLRSLIISKNFHNESLPSEVSQVEYDGFQILQVLGLGGCGFIGEIPKWLVKLSKLEVLDLSWNQLSGSIPGWISNLSGLFYLDLSRNYLHGNFPVELIRLPRLSSHEDANKSNRSYLDFPMFVLIDAAVLQYNKPSSLPRSLRLRGNRLGGKIPIEIGQLTFIHRLDLSDNGFSGNIPDTISSITTLEMLDLSGNQFSGQIPASLKRLHFLSSFSVANNDLEGLIPTGGQFDTFPSTSFQGNPRLCGRSINRSCSEQLVPPHRAGSEEKLFIYITCGIGFGIGFGISFFLFVNTFGNLSAKCASFVIFLLGY